MQVQGKTIAITRPAEDAMEFISLMESHGGQVIPLRTIEVACGGPILYDCHGSVFVDSLSQLYRICVSILSIQYALMDPRAL